MTFFCCRPRSCDKSLSECEREGKGKRERERERMPVKNACICSEPGFNGVEQTAINIVIKPIVIMRIVKGDLDFNRQS